MDKDKIPQTYFAKPYVMVSMCEYKAIIPILELFEKMSEIKPNNIDYILQVWKERMTLYTRRSISTNFDTYMSQTAITALRDEFERDLLKIKKSIDKIYAEIEPLLDEYEKTVSSMEKDGGMIEMEKNVMVNIDQYEVLMNPRAIITDYKNNLKKKLNISFSTVF